MIENVVEWERRGFEVGKIVVAVVEYDVVEEVIGVECVEDLAKCCLSL